MTPRELPDDEFPAPCAETTTLLRIGSEPMQRLKDAFDIGRTVNNPAVGPAKGGTLERAIVHDDGHRQSHRLEDNLGERITEGDVAEYIRIHENRCGIVHEAGEPHSFS